MTLLYENQFVAYYHAEESNRIEEHWNEHTRRMKSEDLKESVRQVTQLFARYRPKYFLSDAQKFYFSITPALQEWIDTTVAPVAYENGLQKVARILSSDFIAQLSIEQLSEEVIGKKLVTQFFDDIEKARNWASD